MDSKVIYDLLNEVREDQKKDSEKLHKVDASISFIQSEVREIKEETKVNTKNLSEHMRRTDGVENMVSVLTSLHQDNQKRIESLEEDSKKKDQEISELKNKEKAERNLKQKIKDNIGWIIGIVAATVGIISKLKGLW